MKNKDKKQMKIDAAVSSAVNAYREGGENTDPLGMYTGNIRDLPPTEAVAGGKTYQSVAGVSSVTDGVPVQDADDL